ncbi:hypothetical protein B0A50_08692 [Salinomyces thailandicus]|uniref:DUF726-domain-containing protein n=1 Tax=Salinomyces thailandicus TaxID=706561 RepID=A0A4U0TJ56_9PEZI|nr:hypothetical protein B0A50_08692 [Salinomyces thailandica]
MAAASDDTDGITNGSPKQRQNQTQRTAADGATDGDVEADLTTLPELKPVVTREKHDAPQAEPPAPDEFGLPVKPPRRRNYSLDELENPEKTRPVGLDGVTEDGHVVHEGEARKVDETETSPSKQGEKDADTTTPGDCQSQGKETDPRSDHLPPSDHTTPQKPAVGATSEWSHMQLAPHAEEKKSEDEEVSWQEMPALAEHRIYDDWGKVLAKAYDEEASGDEDYGYGGLGGASKGYTRVQIDDDAQSATSMDDHTAYLFKEGTGQNTALADEDDEEARDLVSQMQTTKTLLTEAQKFAYVGVVRLAINEMMTFLEGMERTKATKKMVDLATEAMKMWGQKMMVRLYAHMDVSEQEQVMVEQLADHGVRAEDLTPTLMANARVKNPQRDHGGSDAGSEKSARPSVSSPRVSTSAIGSRAGTPNLSVPGTPQLTETEAPPPPAYEEHSADDFKAQDASELNDKDIDLDIRWTVLCDLFLLLIADSVYDARSRTLLEKVGAALSVPWQEIGRFEKRVTDALEMQQEAEKEEWSQENHMQTREKSARKKRLMVMGLCTVGGGLVIGLSAGMLAPVIGAGLAAGFTGIGIAGTGGFLGGTGAAALIGTTGTLIGGHIGLRGAGRRTGAVKTFEYRPLYNNKRVNLIVTVAGWMTGKVDDVRLPFSTVDPIMGDIYSVNWEPEMLQSTGETIQILGTEALTQTIQHILGATFLSALMAGLSLPIVLTKLAYLVDNPWAVSLARADSTGLILADSLLARNLGQRPITLVGFSLGSRVIFSCLRELARRGAIGLVQNVYMFGSPLVVKKDEWLRARAIVSGRFLNAYAINDWILAYLFRATSGGIARVAGLTTVNVPGIENRDITSLVPGHMAYRGMMPLLLDEVGWSVESIEFTEIEDPDPERHAGRQRELIREIEEARREADGKPEKKGFKAFFTRRNKKAREREVWETYDERSQAGAGKDVHGEAGAETPEAQVMFDVDAIRREALKLAEAGGDLEEIKRHLSVREIESTLPALRIQSPRPREAGEATSATGPNGRANAYPFPPPATSKGHPAKPTAEEEEEDHKEENGEITLSFETPERPSDHQRSTPSYPNGISSSSAHHSTSTSLDDPFRDPKPERELEKGNWEDLQPTSARATPAAKVVKNPWADDEHEGGFGGEREVEMSFE